MHFSRATKGYKHDNKPTIGDRVATEHNDDRGEKASAIVDQYSHQGRAPKETLIRMKNRAFTLTIIDST